MRVALYNQMFGMNGKNLISFLHSHYIVYGQTKKDKILQYSNIHETIKIIKEANPDVLGIIEILEGQEKSIISELRKFGFKTFFIYKGPKTRMKLYILSLLAFKSYAKRLKVKRFPSEDTLAGGSGFIGARYKSIDFFLAHLSLPSTNHNKAQLKIMSEYTQGKKQIIMADFNLVFRRIKKYFPDFILGSSQEATCSMTWPVKYFYRKCIDQILLKGLKEKSKGSLKGLSDHKLVYVDI